MIHMERLHYLVFMTKFDHCKKLNEMSFLVYQARKNFIINKLEWVLYGGKNAIPLLSEWVPGQHLKLMAYFLVSSVKGKKQLFLPRQWQKYRPALYQTRTPQKFTSKC